MTKLLLGIGIVFIPFYEIIVLLFPGAAVLAQDTRAPQGFLAFWLALGIGLIAVYRGEIRKCHNRWVLVLIGYLLLSMRLALRTPLVMNNILCPYFGMWEPLFKVTCYFFMFLAVSSLTITRKEIDLILKVMVWCGFAMSLYMFLQWFRLDQFYFEKTEMQFLTIANRRISGNLGQPTIVSPFIAMIIPVALYLKRYFTFLAVAMIVAVSLTKSQVAIGAMIVSLLLFFVMNKPQAILLLLIIGLVSTPFLLKRVKIESSGRFDMWERVIKDWKTSPIEKGKPYSLTGAGLGRFTFLYHDKNKDNNHQAHNEYLQILYDLGLFGLALFLLSILDMMIRALRAWWRAANYRKPLIAGLLCSFVCIALCAGGTFPWQIGPHIFLTIIVIGLLHNQNVLKGGNRCLEKSYQ